MNLHEITRTSKTQLATALLQRYTDSVSKKNAFA